MSKSNEEGGFMILGILNPNVAKVCLTAIGGAMLLGISTWIPWSLDAAGPQEGNRSAQTNQGGRNGAQQERANNASQRNQSQNRTGQTNQNRNNGNSNSRQNSQVPARVTAEREAAALMFVQQHHPEIKQLLRILKQNRPTDYERAIRELFRKSEQLAVIQERGDDVRYELELNIWKTESRARLLAARLARSDREDLRKNLHDVLESHYTFKRQLIERDRDRLAERLSKMDQNLERIEVDFDTIVAREEQLLMRQMRNAMNSTQPNRSGGANPAANDARTNANSNRNNATDRERP